VLVTGNALIGAITRADDSYQLNVNGGSLTVEGLLRLGQQGHALSRRGAGLLNMSDGTLDVQDLAIGSAGGSRSDGLYHQTGGVATIHDEIRMMTENPDGFGTQQLVVGSGATMVMTGTGFTVPVAGDWSSGLLTTDNLSFAGTLRFSPSSSITQNLLVFGEELGENMAGLAASNFFVGTLDLRDLVAQDATLNLLEAENFTTNALYVDSLLMDSPVDPGAFFAGDINVYYNPATSDITGTWAFGSGDGMLIMIPEPGTVLLMAAGGLLLMSRARRRGIV